MHVRRAVRVGLTEIVIILMSAGLRIRTRVHLSCWIHIRITDVDHYYFDETLVNVSNIFWIRIQNFWDNENRFATLFEICVKQAIKNYLISPLNLV